MLVGRKAVKKHPNKHRCRKVWTLTVRVGLDRSVQAGKSGPNSCKQASEEDLIQETDPGDSDGKEKKMCNRAEHMLRKHSS